MLFRDGQAALRGSLPLASLVGPSRAMPTLKPDPGNASLILRQLFRLLRYVADLGTALSAVPVC